MALDQHGTLLKMVVMVSQHHFTGRPCWSWLSWFICLSSRLWALAPAAAVPEMPLSDDARFVLLAEQILRQAGWRGELFLGVKLQDPTWTRDRWEHAQVELTQGRVRQVQARQPGSGLAALAAPLADREDTAAGCLNS